MGSRLRKLKALWGKKKFSDGKTIGGKGRLTDGIISKLTTFYGHAIRANSHNVNEMRQAVWAHTSSTDDEPKHRFCPKGKNSWCQYNVSVHNNTVNEFSHKNTSPKAVSEVIKPVFKDLSHLKLLRSSDSNTVLSGLSSHPRKWKTFVSSKIIEVLPTKHWRHVPSKENPADIASLATKAVHIKSVSDLITYSFIAALRSYSARCGAPHQIYSDKGTNFVGARRKLDDIRNLWLSSPTNEAISYFLSKSLID
ncbi:uncharacterized protein TNCV_4187591 [Trichonephila clavipes]|nr:uncharacterized protein TNCV_4187591 [Trichonephila clavipes]